MILAFLVKGQIIYFLKFRKLIFRNDRTREDVRSDGRLVSVGGYNPC